MNMNDSTSPNVGQATYLLDNAAREAPVRLNALAELFDSGTARHLESCGVDEGWRCLEIGGSVGFALGFGEFEKLFLAECLRCQQVHEAMGRVIRQCAAAVVDFDERCA